MTSGDPVAEAAYHLRAAVAASAYEEARGLLSEYCAQVEAALRQSPPGSEQSAAIARDAQAMFAWVRNMTLTGQALAAACLHRLAVASAYEQPANPTPRIWDVRG